MFGCYSFQLYSIYDLVHNLTIYPWSQFSRLITFVFCKICSSMAWHLQEMPVSPNAPINVNPVGGGGGGEVRAKGGDLTNFKIF